MLRLLPAVVAVLLGACAGPAREPFTLEEQLAAEVPGIPEARAWGDLGPTEVHLLDISPEQVAARRPGPLDYLALSSGGPAGAFGAGLLVGWSEAGTRPEFDVVTGVSSGALIAPFAFVGREGDAALRELWAIGLVEDLGRSPNYLGVLTGSGVVDPALLRDLLEAYVNEQLIAAIAREHAEGRRLLVMTTNLDAQRPAIWNLGAIAASGQPGAPDLIRQVLLASTAVPVVFPPVLIETTTGTRRLQEMHVDGGVSAQIFALPEAVLSQAEIFAAPVGREARLWLVVNYVLPPAFSVTPSSSFGIGARAYGTLIRSDLRSELLATAGAAEDAGLDVRLGSIPLRLPWSPADPFSTSFMRTLFDLGRQAALDGTAFEQGVGGGS